MATYATRDDLRLYLRDGAEPPEAPELHAEAYRLIGVDLRSRGVTDAQVAALDDAALAHLRNAEATKVMQLHYQGMQDIGLLELAKHFAREFDRLMDSLALTSEAPAAFSGAGYDQQVYLG